MYNYVIKCLKRSLQRANVVSKLLQCTKQQPVCAHRTSLLVLINYFNGQLTGKLLTGSLYLRIQQTTGKITMTLGYWIETRYRMYWKICYLSRTFITISWFSAIRMSQMPIHLFSFYILLSSCCPPIIAILLPVIFLSHPQQQLLIFLFL